MSARIQSVGMAAALGLTACGWLSPAPGADIVISEIMADNASGIIDENGDHPDWIELTNLSTQTVNLAGWYLTDTTNDLRLWRFPSVDLAAGARRVVFASGKDRRDPDGNLHTNFKLKDSGEYLGLIRPDGGTVESEFRPAYPPQFSDLSYGFPGPQTVMLVTQGAPARVRVCASNQEYTATFPGWSNNLAFADTNWSSVSTGVGYDTDPANAYGSWLGPGGNISNLVYNKNGSFFLRIKFVASNVTSATTVRYRSRHDDGFRAFLNGKLVVAENTAASPTWNSTAPAERPDEMNNYWAVYPVTNGPALLVNGTNLLAIHAMNFAIADVDFLNLPELEAVYGSTLLTNEAVYLHYATPGALNSDGGALVGPRLWDATDRALPPPGGAGSPAIVVTTRVDQTQRSIPAGNVKIAYRFMYAPETNVTMTALGDGRYVAAIPTTPLAAGLMLRWRFLAVDSGSVTSTLPPFRELNDNDQYYGTVAFDPALTNSRLPLLHWFVANAAAADLNSGTRCSLFFLSNFYDNVFVSLHGQSSSGFPKKPHDFDLNRDNRFLWREGEGRVKDFNLLSNYADKTKARNELAYGVMDEIGCGYHYAFPVRVQTNGGFWAVIDMVEEGDRDWLRRRGYDEDDALYKIYDSLLSPSLWEKKTREFEDKSDLVAFIAAITNTVPILERRRYAYDHINLPDVVSYLVGQALIANTDHGHKNFYMFRDSVGTGEWTIWPWDVDLSFGHNWGPNYYNDTLWTNNTLNFDKANPMYNLPFAAPEMIQMYLRRMRTVMDRWLQPPEQTVDLYFERRFDEVLAKIDPPDVGTSDADLDFAKWSTPFTTNNVPPSVEIPRVKQQYLVGRRMFLFNTEQNVKGEILPGPQPLHAPLSFGAFEVTPARQTEEYFTLVNCNDYAVDISGWSVTGAVQFTFRPGTVIPAAAPSNNIGTLHVVRDLPGFRARTASPTSNEFCFAVGPYQGQLSARGESIALLDDTGAAIASTNWPASPSGAQNYLRVSELMYHPAPPTPAETSAIPFCVASDFEYLEIVNVNGPEINLAGCRFTEGIQFTFPPETWLSAGGRLVIAADTAAFALRYGSTPALIGQYEGYLDNGGERIQLEDAYGEVILDFAYGGAWVPVTDGLGFSLVIDDETAPWTEWDEEAAWRASGLSGGTPASSDPGEPSFPPVIVNEVLAHTDPPMMDTIEILNPGASTADVGGWFLTDDRHDPKKFRIPPGTVLTPGQCRIYAETNFNLTPGVWPSFLLSSTGDDVWLFSGDAQTNLTGYSYGIEFGASSNGVSFGRHVNSVGTQFFVSQSANTLGASNAYPLVGPVAIGEIMFHPPDLGTNANERDEFIELANFSAGPVPLFDPAAPTNTWHLRDAVDFDFPTGVTLPAGGRLLVVGFDPAADPDSLAAFLAVYGLAPGTPVYGPWSGKLSDAGERIALRRPDPPNTNEVPYILVEDVDYLPSAPWDAGADGTGRSLQRIALNRFANDPANWIAATPTAATATDLAADADADGQPDWAEWRAGTDRNSASSRLCIVSVAPTNSGTAVTWESISGKRYFVDRTSNLASNGFVGVGGEVGGLPGTTVLVDTNTPSPGGFYRVRIDPP